MNKMNRRGEMIYFPNSCHRCSLRSLRSCVCKRWKNVHSLAFHGWELCFKEWTNATTWEPDRFLFFPSSISFMAITKYMSSKSWSMKKHHHNHSKRTSSQKRTSSRMSENAIGWSKIDELAKMYFPWFLWNIIWAWGHRGSIRSPTVGVAKSQRGKG
jgi:hypothetical protein